jgi:hypothetical protein
MIAARLLTDAVEMYRINKVPLRHIGTPDVVVRWEVWAVPLTLSER